MRPFLFLLLALTTLPLIQCRSGEAEGPSDEAAPSDEGDAAAPAADEGTGGTDGRLRSPCAPVEGMLRGWVVDFEQEPPAGLAGATVKLLPEGPETTTDADGCYSLPVAEPGAVDVAITAKDRKPHVGFVDSSREPTGGVVHSPVPAQDYAVVTKQLGVKNGPDVAVLVVSATYEGTLRVAAGAQATIAGDKGTPGTMRNGSWVPGRMFSENGPIVAFLELPGGAHEVAVEGPDGSPCLGRSSVTVPAGSVGEVAFVCPTPGTLTP